MENPKKKIALDVTVKAQLAQLTIDNARLDKALKQHIAENEALRKQNVELASVIENDLKAGLKMTIQAGSNYKASDLETLTLEQLQQIDQTLSMGKPMTDATYKNIRAGTASTQKGPTTVGSLFGKTREQILAMQGDF